MRACKVKRVSFDREADILDEGRKEMFYLTTHSTHFIYGYMATDIWLRTILIVRKETRYQNLIRCKEQIIMWVDKFHNLRFAVNDAKLRDNIFGVNSSRIVT